MSPDTHSIAAHGRLAPDPILFGRVVDEEPPTQRVPAPPKLAALLGQHQGGRQEVVDDGIPALPGGPDRAIRPEPICDVVERMIHSRTPGLRIECGVIVEVVDRCSQ